MAPPCRLEEVAKEAQKNRKPERKVSGVQARPRRDLAVRIQRATPRTICHSKVYHLECQEALGNEKPSILRLLRCAADACRVYEWYSGIWCTLWASQWTSATRTPSAPPSSLASLGSLSRCSQKLDFTSNQDSSIASLINNGVDLDFLKPFNVSFLTHLRQVGR